MSEELANVDKMGLRMDRDPDKPITIEEEMEIARYNMSRLKEGTYECTYWTGLYDGLAMAFNLMSNRDG